MFQMEHLHLGEILGEGSFGRVYRGQRHGQAVAVKRTMLTHHAIQEVDILRSLEHTNIIPTCKFHTGSESLSVRAAGSHQSIEPPRRSVGGFPPVAAPTIPG
ncbi:probable cyclin-dependent kinase 9 [Coccinella septempunctata]|uniref:probable cyclin-dependent kinase 9 n=1 Tax=Coccinella septempunctata TaxID=41139 RepID=UPI001D06BF70|nr:probable cyclin-dependent kinase 9 [Coccinella septempunctata]